MIFDWFLTAYEINHKVKIPPIVYDEMGDWINAPDYLFSESTSVER